MDVITVKSCGLKCTNENGKFTINILSRKTNDFDERYLLKVVNHQCHFAIDCSLFDHPHSFKIAKDDRFVDELLCYLQSNKPVFSEFVFGYKMYSQHNTPQVFLYLFFNSLTDMIACKQRFSHAITLPSFGDIHFTTIGGDANYSTEQLRYLQTRDSPLNYKAKLINSTPFQLDWAPNFSVTVDKTYIVEYEDLYAAITDDGI